MLTSRVRRGLAAAAAVAAAGAAPLWSTVADAATPDTKVSFNQDGTFWRLQPRAPVVNVPCLPGDPVECGEIAPTSLTGLNAPNVTDGNMTVGSSGGASGADKGDQFWIVTQPDLTSLGPIDEVKKFTLTLTQAPDNKGDFATPTIKACNIVAPFGVGEGTNPWDDRPPIDCTGAKAPTVDGKKYIFDLTDFAKTWVKQQGYGAAIVPGLVASSTDVTDTSKVSEIHPFQLTVGNANKVDVNRQPVPERSLATIQFVAGADPFANVTDEASSFANDLGSDQAFVDTGGNFSDVGSLDSGSASPGSSVLGTGAQRSTNALGPSARAGASKPAGFAWSLLLLLPLGLSVIWVTGSALGPLGDPIAPRQGGVARLVARRQAERPPS